MRYYRIDVGGQIAFTSHPNGVLAPPDPGALLIEVDAYVVGLPNPAFSTGSGVRIWGIPLGFIGQSKLLNGKSLAFYGGMGKGLPLANPAQSGLIFQGTVQQAFANWVGTSMTLDFVVMAPIGQAVSGGNASAPGGPGLAASCVVNWKAGTQLSADLQTSLQTAYPGYSLDIKISSKLVLNNDETHQAKNLSDLANYVNDLSRRIVGGDDNLGKWSPGSTINPSGDYRGVLFVPDGMTIRVFDGTGSASVSTNSTTGNQSTQGTSQSNPIQILFTDLIGQPTWIQPNVLQVTCVMRSDIKPGTFITLPQTRAVVTSGSFSNLSPYVGNVVFQGTWFVSDVHHVGNYKDPSALSWVTIINAAAVPAAGSSGASVPTGSQPPNFSGYP